MRRIYLILFGVIMITALFGRPKFLGPPIRLERSGVYVPVQSPWVR